MPWLWKQWGTSQSGMVAVPSSVSVSNWSLVTGWFSSVPRSRQLRISSLMAIGSNTGPDRVRAPGSEAFPSTTTEISCPIAAARCLSRIAVAMPPAPPPTMTTF